MPRRGPRSRLSRLRKVTFGLLLAFALLAVLALLIEGVLRLIYPAPLVERLFAPSAEAIGYELASSRISRYIRDGRIITVTTDAAGHRVVPGGPTSGSPAARTLHVLGDSQVFGWDLTDEETIPAQLQERLGPGWRVLNHGVPGYGPFAYAEQLAELPPGDLALVVQTEANDFSDAYSAHAPAFARCGFLVPRNALGTGLPCWALSSYTFVKLTEGFVAFGDPRLPVPIGFNPATRSAAEVLRYRVDSLYGLAEAARTAPTLSAVLPWDGAVVPARARSYRPWLAHPRRIVSLTDGCGLTAAFESAADPDRLFLPQDYHLSAPGAALAADRLAACLASL